MKYYIYIQITAVAILIASWYFLYQTLLDLTLK